MRLFLLVLLAASPVPALAAPKTKQPAANTFATSSQVAKGTLVRIRSWVARNSETRIKPIVGGKQSSSALMKLADKLQSMLPGSRAARPTCSTTLKAFRRGDVYLDYPFEDVKFRYENRTGKAYRRFYRQAEQEVSLGSNLFRDAMSSGKQITPAEYSRD